MNGLLKFFVFYFLDEWLITGSFLFVQEIFFFKEGSVIFWNVPELERNLVLKFLAKHSEDAYEEDIGRVAFDFFLFQTCWVQVWVLSCTYLFT